MGAEELGDAAGGDATGKEEADIGGGGISEFAGDETGGG